MKVELEQAKVECAEDPKQCEEELCQSNDDKQRTFSSTLNNHCTRTMKNSIEELTDFESTVRDDPLESLRHIKKMCVHQMG